MRAVLACFVTLLAAGSATAQSDNVCAIDEAPDIVVCGVGRSNYWGTVGGIAAYSFWSDGHNAGTCQANWVEQSSEHPVITQNLYRLRDGRFEQIGQGWVKHGFAADNFGLCSEDCLPADDDQHLGINCTDPYTSNNGSQRLLGRRSEVHARTGVFPWPPTDYGLTGDAIYKRVQVHVADLDPALNPGAQYWAEVHYVAHDDALGGNQNNNTSIRFTEVVVEAYGFRLTDGSGTLTETPAIEAWRLNDPAVMITTVDALGRYFVGARVTDLGNGKWHYEYAIQNLNADGAGGFSVPVNGASQVTHIGFHDVDYHSGEPYDGTDWPGVFDAQAGKVSWSTATPDELANALRWGTLYNFRFDADRAPVLGTATLNLLSIEALAAKSAQGIDVQTWVPQPCDNDGTCDPAENIQNCPDDCSGSESCNGLDDDHDGAIPAFERDGDGDGYVQCAPWSGSVPGIVGGGDCGPANAAVHPGAAEVCDGLNTDCAGALAPSESDSDVDGFPVCAGDCDDDSPAVYPGAPELCDGQATNCSAPGWPALPQGEVDADGDGYRGCAGDCNDQSAAVNPGRSEACNTVDDDCDGATDEDADGDGFPCATDCDNTKGAVFPGAAELCDGLANDCASAGWPAVPADETDADADGFRPCGGDCDDGRSATYPAAPELCNGIDDDCDGLADEDELVGDGDGDGVSSMCDNCPAVPNPGQADEDGELFREWPYAAVASSQYSTGGYSAMQATGPPQSQGVCDDRDTNWSPLTSTSDPEWIELSYALHVPAVGVDVLESFEQGFVRRIELRDTAGAYHSVWARADTTTCGGTLEARFGETPYDVDRVRVHTAAPDWEEIDAVGLLGVFADADGVGSACDNCPEHGNVGQLDADGDGAGDACDCAPNDPTKRPTVEVEGVVAASPAAGALRLTWEPAVGAASYAIVRGELSALSATHMGDCVVGGWTALMWDDPELPPPGAGYAYLVRGESPECGPGTLGIGAYGIARFNTGGACP